MINFIKPLEDFKFLNFDSDKNVGHFVMINHRIKDSTSNNIHAKSARKETNICYSYEDMYKIINNLNVLYENTEEYSQLILRVYVHINGCETNKVRFEMIKLMLDGIQYNRQNKNIYRIIDHLHCIDETNHNKYYHLDVDNLKSQDDIVKIKESIDYVLKHRKQQTTLDQLILDEYPTVSGYHLITKRFDKELFLNTMNEKHPDINIGVESNSFALVAIIQ